MFRALLGILARMERLPTDLISTVSRGGKGGEGERLPMIRFLLDEKVSSGIEERSVCKFQFIAFFFRYILFVLNYLCKI